MTVMSELVRHYQDDSISKLRALHVALVDFYVEGHHVLYIQDAVEGLDRFGIKTIVFGPQDLHGIEPGRIVYLDGCERLRKLNGLRRQWAALPMCREAITRAVERRATHIHFLYCDWHVSAIAAAWHLQRPKLQLMLTVHGAKGVGGGGSGLNDRLRRAPHRAALRWLTHRCGAIVLVHHENTAEQISHFVRSAQIRIVPYPVRPLPEIGIEVQSEFRKSLGVAIKDKLILCYGGTRFDKGADLAVNALSKLPGHFHLLVAGRPVYFQPGDLRRQAVSRDVAGRLHLMPKRLSDMETSLAFHACDVLLLPYRRGFVGGQSGPLTLAGVIGKPIVAPDMPVLAQTVKKYNLGTLFAAGNLEDMATSVQSAADWCQGLPNTAAFTRDHSVQAFGRALYENYRQASTLSEGA